MVYQFQIEVSERDEYGHVIRVWKSVHPTDGPPYEYATREEADAMRRICYGDRGRVIKV